MSRMLLLVSEWGPAAPVREELPEAARDGWWHELFDISAERCDLLHPPRGNETHLRRRHHVDGLDVRPERAVQVAHLELVLEVGDDAETLDDHGRLPAPGELDDELAERVDLDVGHAREGA